MLGVRICEYSIIHKSAKLGSVLTWTYLGYALGPDPRFASIHKSAKLAKVCPRTRPQICEYSIIHKSAKLGSVMRLRGSTQNIYKRSPFLPLSSAQVPCPSSSANYCPILPRVMHRRLPLKSAQATTQLTHARANHKQRKTWFIPKLKTFKYSKVRIILWSTIRTS
jgi:hypothetical protein